MKRVSIKNDTDHRHYALTFFSYLDSMAITSSGVTHEDFWELEHKLEDQLDDGLDNQLITSGLEKNQKK